MGGTQGAPLQGIGLGAYICKPEVAILYLEARRRFRPRESASPPPERPARAPWPDCICGGRMMVGAKRAFGHHTAPPSLQNPHI